MVSNSFLLKISTTKPFTISKQITNLVTSTTDKSIKFTKMPSINSLPTLFSSVISPRINLRILLKKILINNFQIKNSKDVTFKSSKEEMPSQKALLISEINKRPFVSVQKRLMMKLKNKMVFHLNIVLVL